MKLKQGCSRALPIVSAAAALAGCLPAGAAAKEAPGEVFYARVEPVCSAPAPGHASCFAMVLRHVPSTQAGAPGVRAYAAPSAGPASTGPAGGLTPSNLAGAYGYDPTKGGEGQTVAIVDAFDDPNIEADLGEYDSHYGLGECTAANGCFKKVGETGKTNVLPEADTTGWSVEISLDVEAVRAVCRKCKILLVESNSTSFADLGASVKEAVKLGASEVSNSYGGYETSGVGSEELADYNQPGVLIAAATGDQGWASWVRAYEHHAPPKPASPNTPSSIPTVLAVGGTTLHLTAGETRLSETVWNGNERENTSRFVEGATGGGCSLDFSAPLWQQDAPGFSATGCGSKRSAGDVSAVADPVTGFDIFDTYNCGLSCEEFKGGKAWSRIGGTSLSTPLISGMWALAGGPQGVKYPALTVYGHLGDSAATFDVTKGGNGYCDNEGKACGINAKIAKEGLAGYSFDCEGTTECNAVAGFDGPTGVGSPSSLSIFKPLAPKVAITPPAKLYSATSLAFSASSSTDPYPGGLAEAKYSWEFGDSSGAVTGISPAHTYAAPGEYTVKLTVTDSYGATAKAEAKLKVIEHTVKEIEEEEAKHKAEEEAAKHKAEEEAAAKHKAEEEAAAKHKAEEEAAKHKAEEEAAKRSAEEAASRGSGGGGSIGVAPFKVSVAPKATLAGASLKVSPNGAFTVTVSCPAGATSCEGTVSVQTANAVSARARVLKLASGSFDVAGGRTIAVKLHLSAKARKLLARKHVLKVLVSIADHDASGQTGSSQSSASLRAGKSHR